MLLIQIAYRNIRPLLHNNVLRGSKRILGRVVIGRGRIKGGILMVLMCINRWFLSI